jgi:hypothetical protein
MAKPTIVVVIPTYGYLDYAARAALSFVGSCINEQPYVVIVDDGTPIEVWTHHWAKIRSSLDAINHGTSIQGHRFDKNERDMTRSWNYGARVARQRGAAYTVLTNSDVLFPYGWFDPIRAELDSGSLALAAPMTNAPGHRRVQDVKGVLADYAASDAQEDVNRTQMELLNLQLSQPIVVGRVNGFCIAARTDTLWSVAFSSDAVINPTIKMEGNEEFLEGQLRQADLPTGAVCRSFVFHYRGLTRERGRRGPEAKGMYRRPR